MGWCLLLFQAEGGRRDIGVTGVQTCALPISPTVEALPRRVALLGRESRLPARLRERIVKYAPTHWIHDPATRQRLVRAGFEALGRAARRGGVPVSLAPVSLK